jgi:hypothetical protein
MVLVAVALNNNFSPGNVTSVTDNQTGNTFSLIQRNNSFDSNHGSVELWGCPSLSSASGTYTVSVAWAGTQGCKLAILEAAGTTGSLDQVGTNQGSVTSLTTTAGGANTSANELVIAIIGVCNYNPTAALSNPASSGYTEWAFDNGNSDTDGTPSDYSYKIVSSIETSSASWSWTGATSAQSIIATFPGSGSPGLLGQIWL